MTGPSPRRALQDAPAFVVLVGEAASDHRRIDELREAGTLVILASSPDMVRAWLPDALAEQRDSVASHVVVRVDDLEVDLTEQRARWRGRNLALTHHDLQILALLGRDAGRVWTFMDLLTRVWGTEYFGDGEAVHSAIQRLRSKLTSAGVDLSIESVRGVGFRLHRATRQTSIPG
jgi:DNA-binding response OmpR family regulator